MAAPHNAGCWRGVITRVSGSQVYVVVQRYSPAEIPVALVTDQARNTTDTVNSAQVSAIRAGRRVLVEFLEGRPDSPVIIGTLP